MTPGSVHNHYIPHDAEVSAPRYIPHIAGVSAPRYIPHGAGVSAYPLHTAWRLGQRFFDQMSVHYPSELQAVVSHVFKVFLAVMQA